MGIKGMIPKELATEPRKMVSAVKNGLDAAAKGLKKLI